MAIKEFKNVIFDVDKTESEILSLGANSIIKGQVWIASDTKRIIWRELDGTFTYAKASQEGEIYTLAEKQKLALIEDEANNYVLPSDVVQDPNYTTPEPSVGVGGAINVSNGSGAWADSHLEAISGSQTQGIKNTAEKLFKIESGANIQLKPAEGYTATTKDIDEFSNPLTIAPIKYVDEKVVDKQDKSPVDGKQYVLKDGGLEEVSEVETGTTIVTTPLTESTSGVASTQQAVNIENKNSVETITEALEKLQNVSMVLESTIPFNAGSGSANPVRWDFDIEIASTNTDVLDADATLNYIDFKIDGVRYLFSGEAQVTKGSAQDKILWVQLRKQSDDTPLGDASQIAINWANGETRPITLTGAVDTPSADFQVYFAVWGTRSDGTTADGDVEIESVSTAIQSQGSGASAGKWQDSTIGGNKILKTVDSDYVSVFSGNPSDYAGELAQQVSVVPSIGGDSLIVLGSLSGTQDGTYVLEPTQDPYGFSVYKRTAPSVLYISKDDSASHPYWCIYTSINPTFFNASYYYNGATPDGEYVNPLNPADVCSVTLESGATGTGYATNGDIITYGNMVIQGDGLSIKGQALIGWIPNQSGDYFLAFNVSEASGNNEVIYSFGSDFVPRFSIPASGPGKTTQMYRSVALGGYIVGSENSTLDTDSANLAFDSTFLDFNTGSAGNEAKPDFGVAGAMQVKDGVLIGEDQNSGDSVVVKDGEVHSTGVMSTDTSVSEILADNKNLVNVETMGDQVYTKSIIPADNGQLLIVGSEGDAGGDEIFYSKPAAVRTGTGTLGANALALPNTVLDNDFVISLDLYLGTISPNYIFDNLTDTTGIGLQIFSDKFRIVYGNGSTRVALSGVGVPVVNQLTTIVITKIGADITLNVDGAEIASVTVNFSNTATPYIYAGGYRGSKTVSFTSIVIDSHSYIRDADYGDATVQDYTGGGADATLNGTCAWDRSAGDDSLRVYAPALIDNGNGLEEVFTESSDASFSSVHSVEVATTDASVSEILADNKNLVNVETATTAVGGLSNYSTNTQLDADLLSPSVEYAICNVNTPTTVVWHIHQQNYSSGGNRYTQIATERDNTSSAAKMYIRNIVDTKFGGWTEVTTENSDASFNSVHSVDVATTDASVSEILADNKNLVNVEVLNLNGTTASRPSTPSIGQTYFDTTLGYRIDYNGTNWVDSTGTIV